MLDYEQLVHLHNLRLTPHQNHADDEVEEDGDIVGKACRRCAQHSCTSSNLAALTLHVARMLRDLQVGIVELTNSYREKYQLFESGAEDVNNNQEGKPTTKLRIALIGKARATCGAVNILKLFSHETIVEACQQQGSGGSSYHDYQSASQGVNNVLREAFTYRSRDLNGLDAKIDGQDAAIDLISSIMSFLSTFGQLTCHEGDAYLESPKFFDPLSIPEVYDVVVQVLSLMLVLLSTQLYQPMISSAQLAEKVNTTSNHYFLERLMDYSYWQRQNSRQTRRSGEDDLNGPSTEVDNEPLLILQSCFHWLINRPKPPKRSISSHHVGLTKSVVQQLSDMAIAPDGMYESHSIVMSILPTGESTEKPSKLSVPPSASATQASNLGLIEKQSASSTTIALGTDDNVGITSPGHVSGTIATRTSSKLLLPLRSIIFLSSSLFLLPIRLVKLAFRVIGKGGQRVLLGNKNSLHGQDISTSDHATLQHLQSQIEKASGYNMTNNILWITESPIADLSSALILLLSNNCRANLESGNAKQRNIIAQNPFRIEMATLNDKRWDGQMTKNSLFPPDKNTTTTSSPRTSTALSLDFESLFASFGRITHTEVGALLLYNMLQSSPIFAASLMARSDLDTLVMPILRTLYFSSKLSHETSHAQSRFLLEKDQPFRAQSQLYVILILLLIFSQDPSFGRDSFRRTTISKVTWYKERQMKEVSLGSMIIVVLLKAITFNLNRLQDEFLLSNCIAVLLNLSPHIVDIHPYVSSRLVSVTVSCFKRYAVLVDENNGQIECDGDMSSPLGMHGEVGIFIRMIFTIQKTILFTLIVHFQF